MYVQGCNVRECEGQMWEEDLEWQQESLDTVDITWGIDGGKLHKTSIVDSRDIFLILTEKARCYVPKENTR